MQRRHQFSQPLPNVTSALPHDFAAGIGDGYNGRAPITEIDHAADDSAPLESLDQLCQRGLAEASRSGQRG